MIEKQFYSSNTLETVMVPAYFLLLRPEGTAFRFRLLYIFIYLSCHIFKICKINLSPRIYGVYMAEWLARRTLNLLN